MKKVKFFMAVIFSVPFLSTSTFAQTKSDEFKTPQDILHNDTASNIYLKNNRNSAATVYGLYVRQFSFVTPGDTCDHATVMYSGTNNITAGAFVMPTVINAGQSTIVGSNYLYNLIYGAIYYLRYTIPSEPPGCALPGCTWGADTQTYNWCVYLGALAPVSASSDYTATVPPAAYLASSEGNYNYNLVSDYVYLGPISCNDQTLTCTVTNKQTQAFS